MRKTIRNVTIVVPVLMTSCHVSEKWKIGPVTAHARMTATATANAQELPAQSVAASENLSRACPIGPVFGPSAGEGPRAFFAAPGLRAVACAALLLICSSLRMSETATQVPRPALRPVSGCASCASGEHGENAGE